MKISPDQAPGSVEPQSTAGRQENVQLVSKSTTTASAVEKASADAAAAIVTPVQRQTDVTFRRDTNGRIYYIVTDAHSGKEIIELPAKKVRDVGKGIEDYLQKEESKVATHVELKA